MGDKDTPQAPALPKGIPPDLEKFLTCKSDEVTVKDGELSWLSVSGKDLIPADLASVVPDKILNGTVHPSMTITPDPSAPGKAEIKIGIDVPGLGTVGPSLPASITDGTLTADTSGLPQALKDPIESAIKNLNDLFKANGYKWGPATFGSGTTKLTKVKLAPATQTTTPPPAPPPGPPKTTPVPPPTTPPPVSGGCLGILFLGLAVVGIGAILLFGGPALGLFGAAAPGASQGTTTSTATTASSTTVETTTTTTTTPAAEVVQSSDGLIRVTVPVGALPTGTVLTVTPQGPTGAPPELGSTTIRSHWYRVGPTDATLSLPLEYERIIDLTAQGIDPERQGYPLIQLAVRTPDGKWSWLDHQSKLVGGMDGMGDEHRPTQTASLSKLGDVFGFGGPVWLFRQPYPEAGSTFFVGQPIPIGAVITGADHQALPSASRPTVANVAPVSFGSPTGVTYSQPVSVSNPTRQALEITATCTQPGDYVVGVQADVTPTAATSLLDTLHLNAGVTSNIEWTTSIHCQATPPSSQILTAGCVSVVHTAIGSYPSHFHWLWRLVGLPDRSLLYVSYHVGTSRAISFGKIPVTGGTATADTGITSYGTWTWDSLAVAKPDGSTIDLTKDLRSVFGPSVTVTSTPGSLAGNACQ